MKKQGKEDNTAQPLEEIRNILQSDRYAAHAGIELLEISPGHARARMGIKEKHLNALGIVNGGAIYSLADYCFAAASCSRGRLTVTLNANISYMKAVTTGFLIADAEEISKGNRIVNYTVRVKDDHDELVALFQGVAYRK